MKGPTSSPMTARKCRSWYAERGAAMLGILKSGDGLVIKGLQKAVIQTVLAYLISGRLEFVGYLSARLV